MTGPDVRQSAQLLRLRGLRVQRAREAVARAEAAVEQARAAVAARARQVQAHREQMVALADAVAYRLAADLPRWSAQVRARREHLADQLEREEYALIDDEEALERAQEQAQQARAELTRALAREDAVRGLVDDARRQRRLAADVKAEIEVEDQGRIPARVAA